MKDIILYDDKEIRDELLPLTYLRPVAQLRLGIDTIAEKWQEILPGRYSFLTQPYLAKKFPVSGKALCAPDTLWVAGHVLPDYGLAAILDGLEPGQAVVDKDGKVVAHCGPPSGITHTTVVEVRAVRHIYDIFLMNAEQISMDYDRLCRDDEDIYDFSYITVIGPAENLYIHPDARYVGGCTINVTAGPVYIGPDAEVMEGACLRGPLAICAHSVVNMGTRIYGGTTIGPWCKVGGELNNVVMLGYSNKAHDGFLGNAVIGEWCNLGAGCTASNLKNDYSEIKLWNYPRHRFMRTGLQFCGLIMADHSKTGVNTMLNTATVAGVGVNIHGSGFPRPFLASFTEGSPAGYTDVPMERFFDIARKAMARRGVELSAVDIDILNHVRQLSEDYR